MKKTVAILISLIIMLTGINKLIPSYAEETQNEIEYTDATSDMFAKTSINSGRLLLAQYNGKYSNIKIPNKMEYNGKTYNVALNNTFDSNTTVKNILFEEGIYLQYNSTMFNGAVNLETVRIENNGHFLNEKTSNHSFKYTFKNCRSLKDYYDLSQFNTNTEIIFTNCVSLKDITSLPKNPTSVQIINNNSSYGYTSTELERISTPIPASAKSFIMYANNISGEIIFEGENTLITISSRSTTSYFNESSLTLKVPNNSETLKSALTFVSKGRHTIKVETTDGSPIAYNKIFALGDSLTAGNYYIPQLNALFDDNTIVYNYGVESDKTVHGLRRMGVTQYEITVDKDFVIPSSHIEKAEIKISAPYTASAKKIAQDTGGINCVTINGIKGTFSFDANEEKNYFNRLSDGEEVYVSKGSKIVTELNSHYKKGDPLIVYLGTNDSPNSSQTVALMVANQIQKLLDYCQPRLYVVVGVATGSCSKENSRTYEALMEERFSYHFLNMREYFINNAYKICSNLEISDSEQAQLNSGTIPSEFYNDGLHWKNSTGGKVVAQAIFEKYNEVKEIDENGCKVHKNKIKVIQKASFDCSGLIIKTCSVCNRQCTERIEPIKKVYLEKEEYNYIGYEIKPKVYVKDRNGKTIDSKYYGVLYYNNKKSGIARVEISFFGRYKGNKTLNFVIKPKSSTASKTSSVITGVSNSLLSQFKTSLLTAIRNNGPVLSALGDHLFGSSTSSTFHLTSSGMNTSYGYGTRIKAPKSPITKLYLKTMVSEECDLLCTIASSDLKSKYYCAKAHVTPQDTECCFRFLNSFVIDDQSELYVLVSSDKSVMCEGMTTMKYPNTLNSEIGAANAKASKGGNVYCDDGTSWKYRNSARTDEMNIYGLGFYIFCRNDYFNVKYNTIYVAPDGSDETGNGSQSNPYATIFYANSTITGSSYFNRYTIKVADGEYSDLSTMKDSGNTRAIICKNYVSYEGNVEHPESCVIIYDGSKRDYQSDCTYSKVQSKAIFEISSSCRPGRAGITTSIKGFKLIGRNLRYVLHFDTAGGGIGSDWDIGNLIINYQGNPECVNDNAKHYAIGCGMAQFEKAYYHDIAFTGTQTTYSGTEYNYIYYGHNNAHNQTINMGGLVPNETEFVNSDLNNGTIIIANLANNIINYRIKDCSNIGRISRGTENDKLYLNVYINETLK